MGSLTGPTPNDLLTVNHDHRGATVVVRATGEVDLFTAHILECALSAACAKVKGTPGMVVVDLSGVHFAGIIGLRLLQETHQWCQRHNIPLRIVGTNPAVLALFRAAGTNCRFHLCATIDDALRTDPLNPPAIQAVPRQLRKHVPKGR